MTDDEARKLATRFVDTWPTGPKAYTWRDIFISLDRDDAAIAYRTLLADDNNGRAPTPGQFHAHYRAITRVHNEAGHRRPVYTGEPMPLSDPRAQAAFDKGYRLGQNDLWLMSGGKLGAPLSATEPDEVA